MQSDFLPKFRVTLSNRSLSPASRQSSAMVFNRRRPDTLNGYVNVLQVTNRSVIRCIVFFAAASKNIRMQFRNRKRRVETGKKAKEKCNLSNEARNRNVRSRTVCIRFAKGGIGHCSSDFYRLAGRGETPCMSGTRDLNRTYLLKNKNKFVSNVTDKQKVKGRSSGSEISFSTIEQRTNVPLVPQVADGKAS